MECPPRAARPVGVASARRVGLIVPGPGPGPGLALALALAACGGPAAAPIGNTTAAAGTVVTGPAPALTLTPGAADGSTTADFGATGFPAVASDGANVVFAVQGEDGARAAPNLTLLVRDRADAVVHRLEVLSANDGEAMLSGEPTPAPVMARLAEANRYLQDTHAQRGWVPLTPMTLVEQPEAGYGATRRADGAGFAIEWDAGRVVVRDGERVVVDRQTQGWTIPDSERCPDCGVCSNPSFLAGAWSDRARKLIVVRIAYTGTDMCWEPDSQEHVVAWE